MFRLFREKKNKKKNITVEIWKYVSAQNPERWAQKKLVTKNKNIVAAAKIELNLEASFNKPEVI